MDRSRLEREGYSVAALREIARRRLPRMVFDFCDGGAEDEITRERNEAAFADWEFLPTPLNGTSARDQSVLLFGERLALPVIIGPTGLSGMLWPRGEVAAARAAAAAGTVYTMSHGSTVSIEQLAQATSRGRCGSRTSCIATAASPARSPSGRRPPAIGRWS